MVSRRFGDPVRFASTEEDTASDLSTLASVRGSSGPSIARKVSSDRKNCSGKLRRLARSLESKTFYDYSAHLATCGGSPRCFGGDLAASGCQIPSTTTCELPQAVRKQKGT